MQRWCFTGFWVVAVAVWLAAPAPAQRLTLAAGTRLELKLPARIRLHRVGQKIQAELAAPVYADNQLALAEGTPVLGAVVAVRGPHWLQRLQAALGGDFSPTPQVAIHFTALTTRLGTLAITTASAPDTPPLHLVSAAGPKPSRLAAGKHRLDRALHQREQDLKTLLHQQTRWATLKHEAAASLPLHPTWLAAGSEYAVRLTAPLALPASAPPSVAPVPLPAVLPAGLVLHARLEGAVSSQTAHWGTPVVASVTQPAYDAAGRLLIPQGAQLQGYVTQVRPARRWGRSGQLRFTFSRLSLPAGVDRPLLGQLTAAASSRALAMSGEGGVQAAKPSTASAALALGLLATTAVAGDSDNAWSLNAGSGTHFHLWGTAMAALIARARPLALVLGFVGASRTVYARWIARGPVVDFPAGTRIVVQTAPPPPGQPLVIGKKMKPRLPQ